MTYYPNPPAGNTAASRAAVVGMIRASRALPPANSDAERAVIRDGWAQATGAPISAANPAMVWRSDLDRIEISENGTTWWSYRLQSGGVFAGSTSATGEVLIPHGLGVAPAYVSLTPVDGGNEAIARIARPVLVWKDAANICVRVARTDTPNWLTSNPVKIEWTATL